MKKTPWSFQTILSIKNKNECVKMCKKTMERKLGKLTSGGEIWSSNKN